MWQPMNLVMLWVLLIPIIDLLWCIQHILKDIQTYSLFQLMTLEEYNICMVWFHIFSTLQNKSCYLLNDHFSFECYKIDFPFVKVWGPVVNRIVWVVAAIFKACHDEIISYTSTRLTTEFCGKYYTSQKFLYLQTAFSNNLCMFLSNAFKICIAPI